MPAHAVRRRPALPALLLSVSAAALGGLALLPAAGITAPLSVAAAAVPATEVSAESERAAILGRPPLRRLVAPKSAAPRVAVAVAVAAKLPVARPAVRAARSKRAPAPAPIRAGYACPISASTSFTDTWGEPRPGGRRHQGTDVLAAYGAPVVAVTSGVVELNNSSSGGFALYLRGSDGDTYYYAHNSRNVASDGERVSAGEVIAYVGTSGNARGGPPHVHFERQPGGGAAVNSYPFLRRACG